MTDDLQGNARREPDRMNAVHLSGANGKVLRIKPRGS